MYKKNYFIQKVIGFLFVYSCLFFSSLFSDSKQTDPLKKQLKINIITQNNGKGLSSDQKVLREALEKLDCSVTILDFLETTWHRAHINIFIQVLVPEMFPMARQNWFISNPEWYDRDIQLLNRINLILCRTKESERIFRQMNLPTYYLGFTGIDCYRENIQKDYSHLLHLAGGSHLKGSQTIKNIWSANSTLPLLTIVDYLNPFISTSFNLRSFPTWLPEEQLRRLQNQCGIHLCPSETEGFGHYIHEAMSTCAVVITTDAPPMNEFIQNPDCLIPYIETSSLQLATTYKVDPEQLIKKIEFLINLTEKELIEIGEENRFLYLDRQQEFHERLKELILTALPLLD